MRGILLVLVLAVSCAKSQKGEKMDCPSTVVLDSNTKMWTIPSNFYRSGECEFNIKISHEYTLSCNWYGDLNNSLIEVVDPFGRLFSSKTLVSMLDSQIYTTAPGVKIKVKLVSSNGKNPIFVDHISCFAADNGHGKNVFDHSDLNITIEPYLYPVRYDSSDYTNVFESFDKKKMKVYFVSGPNDPIFRCFDNGCFLYNSTDPKAKVLSNLDFVRKNYFETNKFIYYNMFGGYNSEAFFVFVDPTKFYDTSFIYHWNEGDIFKEIVLNATEKPAVVTVISRERRGLYPTYLNSAVISAGSTLSVFGGIPNKPINKTRILATFNSAHKFVAPTFFGGQIRSFYLDKGIATINISEIFLVSQEQLKNGMSGKFTNNLFSLEPYSFNFIQITSFGISFIANLTKTDPHVYGENEIGRELAWEGSPNEKAANEVEEKEGIRPYVEEYRFMPSNGTVTLFTKNVNLTLTMAATVEYFLKAK